MRLCVCVWRGGGDMILLRQLILQEAFMYVESGA